MSNQALPNALPQVTALSIYKTMTRIEACDQRIQQLLAAGALQFQYYPCGGQEAIPAAIAPLLNPDDQVVTNYRGVHDIVAKGTPMVEIIAEMMGKVNGTSKGKGGAMHLSDPNAGIMVTTGIVGAGMPIANGLALAAKLKNTGRVVIVNFGEGASNIGAFNESINMAALWDLPIIFLCQNNAYAEYTSFEDSTRSKSIAGRAAGYGLVGETVDGTDPDAIHAAAKNAVDRARSGKGPTLLECTAYRLQGHSFGSEEDHMDQEELAAARANPPIAKFRAALIERGNATAADLDAIEAAAKAEVEDAVEQSMAAEMPGEDELYKDVFADPADIPYVGTPSAKAEPDLSGRAMQNITMCQAITQALDLALEKDPDVFLLGEDIADPAGGVTKATVGLSTKHGVDRVRATPISEQAIIGAAIGASLSGMKPVAEIMINDFTMVCMDQIANHAAKLRYMSGGRTSVPITIRTVTAGNIGNFAAQHSQSLEAFFTHTPGMKVIAPSTAADAKGLLLAAIADPDPVMVIEPMRCYYVPAEVPEGYYEIPLGKAAVRREGKDVTLISYGWAAVEASAAAEALAADGIDAEVIDLRSLVPLDFATCLASVEKTGRAVIAHAAVEFGGFGAELAAKLSEELHGKLKAPIKRVGGTYTPVPFTPSLESLHFLTADRIKDVAKQIAG
ncbi:MAG: dehydrogenase [Rhodospirillaceae bacterium]|jgi:pyruvate/2-oxoglutarate/acetoin dehydrogenase E1 component/TPP-dependent pyruvate/acetoin dehydrogenase alpha subunit|nr:dehydrogenase [Rhodospirillaceae bacterium]MBT5566339.1 dehydrogenase [Rhodospirillaceae bacterium]MBT6088432.1 dehydrogenase [Rhodospirillaceae bacterium]